MAFTSDTRLKWADFPRDEYEARLARAQRLMTAEGIDVLVLNAHQNVEYFSGFLTGHWDSHSFPTAALVVHRSKDPVLVIPQFFAGTAWSTSWVDRLATFPEPHANPREFATVLIDAVRMLGGPGARIAFDEGSHLAPVWNMDDYRQVMAALAPDGVRSGASVVWGCRSIKSDREIDRMRWLTSVTDAAIDAARADLALGQTEVEIGTRIAMEMMERGAEGTSFRNIRAGSDRYHCSDSLPQERPLVEGDLLIVDTGARFNGYVTDVAYTTLMGEATDQHKRIYDIVVRAQDAAVAMCRPGVPANEVFLASARIIEESGLPTLDMIGHCIGMELHEPIMLTPYNHEPLEAGMVLSVEPWLYDPSGLGVFALEEHVVVTDGEPEMLSTVERESLLEIR